MHTRQVRILGTGKYLPKRLVTDEEMDMRLQTRSGWVRKTTDVAVRHFAGDGETASYMGARAAEAALAAAGLTFADIDCLVCTSGTKEQALPSTASLIQLALGEEMSGVPAFDIDATCISFLTGLDVMSYLVDAGRYRHVLLVSSEIASVGLNWDEKESAGLFGDGAAAAVIGRSQEGEASAILNASMKTYGKGARLSEIRGGGTRLHPREHNAATEKDFLFDMNGQAIFKMASKLLPGFVDDLLIPAGLSMADFKVVIPHQGSAMAMRLLRKKLGITEEQLMYITPNHGNTIAASIPMGLHEAINQGKIGRGDKVLLIGTAAGLSLGGMVLVY
ncbi:3-oxoacyl-[acyl-carrier-protein] synthase-3 [Paenibacillus phyllosphaerae]|uniref:3-oxoacyl-[acyl-carrier-protein] synthase-3 n=1 Tax=Paenibacillus phyllosphaerae TaxID=274593 RepID=A0A7W5AVS3_9BACL|nr:beta-ketoacyl-ACP synthase III [Paenibacillus phyllosphaerae]MBB3109685.1 3-oxoacyl-[acyl-carrier-protein] synthase-3 [Paenibacillus phyllosphaerae]